MCDMENQKVGAYSLPEDKKLICGIEGENVVAHGRLLSPARVVSVLKLPTFQTVFCLRFLFFKLCNNICIQKNIKTKNYSSLLHLFFSR